MGTPGSRRSAASSSGYRSDNHQTLRVKEDAGVCAFVCEQTKTGVISDDTAFHDTLT